MRCFLLYFALHFALQPLIFRFPKIRIYKAIWQDVFRWVIAYHDVLRPKLVKKQMRFIKPDAVQNWKNLYLDNEVGITLWGAEPAAAILTNKLVPEKYSIYTTQSWQSIGKGMGLVPDINGKIEILQVFWKQKKAENIQTTPSVLVYADLIGSGYSRNIETAQIILENELQYIK